MKINIHTPITNLQGTAMTDSATKKNVTLGMISIEALLQDDKDATGQQKLDRFLLAQRINSASEDPNIEVTPEEAASLKELIARGYPPLICGQAWLLLNKGD